MRGLIIFFGFFFALAAASSEEKKIVCYVADWTGWRQGAGRYDIDNVDTNLCTHVIYAFAGMDENGVKDPIRGTDGLEKLKNLKKTNSNIKILAAVGGWSEGSSRFSSIASSPQSRNKFAQVAIKFMEKWNLDGIDLDWEYPAQHDGSSPQDVANFVKLVKEMKKAFSQHQKNFLLTAAVVAAESSASKSYRIKEISDHLDFINLMSYDLHGSWESKTGMHSGLYGSPSSDKLTVDSAVKYWLSQGCPAKKLILGVPFYGRTWTLAAPRSNGVDASTAGAGNSGPYSQAAGSLTYYEICEKIAKDGWIVKYDDVRRVPYAFKGNQWVGFENVQSVKEKAKYVEEHQLGGAMVWAIDNDDTKGICGKKYPLLKSLNEILRNGDPVIDFVDPKVTFPGQGVEGNNYPEEETNHDNYPEEEINNDNYPEEETNNLPDGAPANSGQCTVEGLLAGPDCGFIVCAGNAPDFTKFQMSCPTGLCFNPAIKSCDWPQN